MDTVGLTLQILTLAVAAVGPFLAYRYACRLAVTQNRGLWLDALRDDIAKAIALADNIASLNKHINKLEEVKAKQEAEHLLREKAAELQVLRFRIRLRLRTGNPNHELLISALEDLIGSPRESDQNRTALRLALVERAETVIQQVWKRIEKGG